MRHVAVMAATGAVGLVAIFAVDLVNLFYISLLGHQQIAAAVGFSGVVGFFQTSVSIGLMIGVGAVVSRAIGAGHPLLARRLGTSSLALMAAAGLVVGLATVAVLGPILTALGARGETRDLAFSYLLITAPSLPLLALGMGASALLRAAGEAKAAMNITLLAALATAVMDPILIFGLHMDLQGAAVSMVASRLLMAVLSLRFVARRGLAAWPASAGALLRHAGGDGAMVLRVAGPAILTNLATPVGAAFVTRSMAGFGAQAVAGQATVDRITPVAFGIVYALSGAVGPIIAQNLGAGRLDRVRATLRDSLVFVLAAVTVAWAILAAAQNLLVWAFSAPPETAALIRLFCDFTAAGFLFSGALFVGNAAFNNMGFPLLATGFNWGRATLGTIPFVAVGAQYGPAGVMIGQALGGVLFGIGAAIAAFVVVGRMAARDAAARHTPGGQAALPGSTGHAALAAVAGRAEDH